ncbi:HAMP domain-containing histidine kinase [Nostoc sp. NMS4]|uniref:HAMP domain-containing sensor histidine kinase n=1 Tax=Nostoc sp. NMS4 TaxID=2815390 RepID=UPI0025D3145A|nr:HAMP domain-containing histidine kinase [Nostoc sp. NMS4]MBN3923750.1 HAMP domain-containing histidine kinase [Nostoc sp. NMS4]
MFAKIRRRLLLSYLIVLSFILGGFAIAVRIVFTHSFYKQQTQKLAALAQVGVANAEFDNGQIRIENDLPQDKLLKNHQELNWFDTKGNLIQKQGQDILSLPAHVKEGEQISTGGKNRIQSVTLPIISSDDKELIGYVRASQSLEEFDETLNKLDLGLGGGIVVALIISGAGGVWLTHQAMQPIEESFERLKQFTADASHELRNPLMAIKSNAGVALKYPEGMRESDAEKFQAISSATNQMTRLTEDLLFLARHDNIPNHIQETVNLSSILNNLVQLYQPQAMAKEIHLKSQLTEKLYLLGDPNQITRLFSNLIQNAIHYTLSKGTIEIIANRSVSHLIVNVQDTGVGIAPGDLENIFERFWRADKSRSYNSGGSGGSGLGLAIAQAIAESHGGLITATSQLGIGSCFTVHLPVF